MGQAIVKVPASPVGGRTPRPLPGFSPLPSPAGVTGPGTRHARCQCGEDSGHRHEVCDAYHTTGKAGRLLVI